MRRALLVVLVVAACKREGDHCQIYEQRCDGNAILTCQQANTKADMLTPHKSNWFDRVDCPAGTTCVATSARTADCIDPRVLASDAARGD